MGFSRQEYWSGLPFPSPGDLPYLGIEPRSPALQADTLPTELSGKSRRVDSNPRQIYMLGGSRSQHMGRTVESVAYQASQSMGFSRQGYWRGLPFPSPGDLPYPGIEPRSPALQADSSLIEPPVKPFLRTLNFEKLFISRWDINSLSPSFIFPESPNSLIQKVRRFFFLISITRKCPDLVEESP